MSLIHQCRNKAGKAPNKRFGTRGRHPGNAGYSDFFVKLSSSEASMAIATTLYLVYLFTPIVLLFIGSFGGPWFNTLLPSGFTADWYLQVASDGSFRRAFWTSLRVCLLTCVIG